MADEVDNAFVIDVNEHVINNQQPFVVSEVYCLYCGIDIPEKRRSLGNVKYCLECQSLYEKGKLK